MKKTEVMEKLSIYEGVSKEEVRQFREVGGLLFSNDNPVTDQSLPSVVPLLGIPKNFLQKCPIDLQVSILNHFSQQLGYPSMVTKDDRVIAFAVKDSLLISPNMVIEKIEKNTECREYDKVLVYDNIIDIYVVGETEKEVVKGDIVKGGVGVMFSPLGIVSPEITSYTYRLLCSNGLIAPESLSRFKMGSAGDGFDSWFSETLPRAYDIAFAQVEKFREMRNVKLNGNTPGIFRHLVEKFPLVVQNLLYEEVLREKPGNLYELMNIITAFASHKVENPLRMKTLMMASGGMATHYETCPSCHRVIEGA